MRVVTSMREAFGLGPPAAVLGQRRAFAQAVGPADGGLLLEDPAQSTGARDQFAALLPVIERVLGPGHPGTLATRNNLAYLTGQAGIQRGPGVD